MAKGIYSLKMYALRDEFGLNEEGASKFHSICKFIVFVNFESWYRSPFAISAPNNELNLIKKLVNYKSIDEEIRR